MQILNALGHLEKIYYHKKVICVRRKFAKYAKSENVVFSELFGNLGSNFQNKLVLMIPTSGQNTVKLERGGSTGLLKRAWNSKNAGVPSQKGPRHPIRTLDALTRPMAKPTNKYPSILLLFISGLVRFKE